MGTVGEEEIPFSRSQPYNAFGASTSAKAGILLDREYDTLPALVQSIGLGDPATQGPSRPIQVPATKVMTETSQQVRRSPSARDNNFKGLSPPSVPFFKKQSLESNLVREHGMTNGISRKTVRRGQFDPEFAQFGHITLKLPEFVSAASDSSGSDETDSSPLGVRTPRSLRTSRFKPQMEMFFESSDEEHV